MTGPEAISRAKRMCGPPRGSSLSSGNRPADNRNSGGRRSILFQIFIDFLSALPVCLGMEVRPGTLHPSKHPPKK
jgi:hypothetical protein